MSAHGCPRGDPRAALRCAGAAGRIPGCHPSRPPGRAGDNGCMPAARPASLPRCC
ncbi:hypothetical protein ISF6_4966 [Piscinibacter sakaiensis]|uniref:Uncharacterized protein n=1 Tax=Piscinibacter sakaiensis TaxID=1547922 RepID=A0A0K8P770_PISS1|nr:hypothetical protein ISF6_4966 [Piscinibacter sakaiensis]